jgi:hypothetical protein
MSDDLVARRGQMASGAGSAATRAPDGPHPLPSADDGHAPLRANA